MRFIRLRTDPKLRAWFLRKYDMTYKAYRVFKRAGVVIVQDSCGIHILGCMCKLKKED